MRMGHLELFVSDMDAAITFYKTMLGCEVIARNGTEYTWIRFGDVELLLRSGWNMFQAPEYTQAPMGIVLYTRDIQGEAQQLADRGVVFKGYDGSEHCLTFTDPDGNWFQLVNPEML